MTKKELIEKALKSENPVYEIVKLMDASYLRGYDACVKDMMGRLQHHKEMEASK